MGEALRLLNQQKEGSKVEYQGVKYNVQNVGGELKLVPVNQAEVLADQVLAFRFLA